VAAESKDCRRSHRSCVLVHALPSEWTVPCRSSSFDSRCRARIKSGTGISLALNTSPVCPSIAAATTDRACTSSPTLVRSRNTGAPTHVGKAEHVERARQPTRLRERGPGQQTTRTRERSLHTVNPHSNPTLKESPGKPRERECLAGQEARAR